MAARLSGKYGIFPRRLTAPPPMDTFPDLPDRSGFGNR